MDLVAFFKHSMNLLFVISKQNLKLEGIRGAG
jgi:hypothetical protein